MPVITKEFKEGVAQIPIGKLQKLVLKISRGNKEIYELINIQYVEKDIAELNFFEETKLKAINSL